MYMEREDHRTEKIGIIPGLDLPNRQDTEEDGWLVGFYSTFSTNRLYHAIGVRDTSCMAKGQDKHTIKQ